MNPPFKTPLVIGYKGEIGSFILNGLLKVMPKALDIWRYDKNELRSEQVERIDKSDVIFLCVPLQDTLKWFDINKELLRGKIVIEQCSIKKDICTKIKRLERRYGFILLSMHILFRPGATPDKEDRRVALIENWHWDNHITDILRITDSHLVMFKNYSTHDVTMAYQQAFLHRILLVADNMLSTLEGKTYISGKVRELAKRIRSGDATLYSLIQGNKYLPKVLEKFKDKILDFDIDREMR
jgi:prephenate dehydrogenase